MLTILQFIVVSFAVVMIISALVGKQTHLARAWKKMALVMLSFGMMVAVLFPGITNATAHLLGVGRGADLLLYTLILIFIGYALNGYIHRQTERDRVYRLARKLALYEAFMENQKNDSFRSHVR